jgi:membrane protease YdiL (CAAX protease family)
MSDLQSEFQHESAPEPPIPAGSSSRQPIWDFGRAIIFYVFLMGSTIILGVMLLLTVGFKLSAVFSELGLYLVLPFLLSRIFDTGWGSWMRWPRISLSVWGGILLALTGLGVLVSNIPVVVDRVYPMSENYLKMFELFLRANSTGELIILLIVAAVIPGICEEVAFRGLIQGGIRRTYGVRTAVIVTSLLFALIHLSPWNFLALIAMGLFLGILRERTGSIWPGAVAHAINNAIALFIMMLAPSGGDSWQYDFVPLWINGIALVLLVGGMMLFWRYRISETKTSTDDLERSV